MYSLERLRYSFIDFIFRNKKIFCPHYTDNSVKFPLPYKELNQLNVHPEHCVGILIIKQLTYFRKSTISIVLYLLSGCCLFKAFIVTDREVKFSSQCTK